jgi:hypothetical protein
MVFDPLLAGSVEAVPAGLADGVSPAFVLVVGSDVAGAGVKPNAVVLVSDPVELEVEHGRVGELFEVGPVCLDVSEQRLDPGLVGGVPGRPSRWAMAIIAKNSRVGWLIIGPPLSDMASSSG